MIHARPEKRQSYRHVYAGIEAHQFYGDVSLVVVLHDDDVERARPGPHHNGIGRMRPRRIYAFFYGGGHGRRYLLYVLGTQETVLPGVGVQAGDGNPRALDAQFFQRLVGETDDGQFPLGPGPLYGLLERDVGRDVDHLQLVCDEHHRVVFRARQLGQDLGVTGIRVARQVHGLLVERRRRYRPDAPRARQPCRPLDVAEGRVAGPRVEFAEREILRQFGLGDHIYGARLERRVLGFSDDVRAQRQVQQARSPLQSPRVAHDDGHVVFSKVFFVKGSGYDLRPDSGRVPHRHGYEGLCHAFLSSPLSASTAPSSVSGPPKPPALVTTGYGLGPIRVPMGTPVSTSPSSLIPEAPSRRATPTAVAPPVKTSPSNSPSSERSPATSARSSRTDSLEATLSSGERTTAHVPPASASLAAPTAFCTVLGFLPWTGTSTSPYASTSRLTCSRATSLRLPTTTRTGRTGPLCTLASPAQGPG